MSRCLRSALPIATALCALAIALPATASAHTAPVRPSAKRSTQTEKRLRQLETQALGPRHAAEHAAQRRAARRLRIALRDPRTRARLKREQHRARLRARKAAAADPAIVGRWQPAFPIPVFGVNAAMLPTGKVLFYAYPKHPNSGTTYHEAWAALWDPSEGYGAASFRRVDPPLSINVEGQSKPANIWCSGTSFLADGQVLVTGGNLDYEDLDQGKYYRGLKEVYTFDPFTETWRRQPDMKKGRWYPSQLLMPDGRTMIIQGLDDGGRSYKNHDIEIFTPAAQRGEVGRIDKVGEMPHTDQWSGELYPQMFWMPSGRGLVAGPTKTDNYVFDAFPAGQGPTIKPLPRMITDRLWGNAVLVPGTAEGGSTRILQLGGSPKEPNASGDFPATRTSEYYDESNPGAWRAADAQNIGRSHANTVLLPDRSMVTVGGGVGEKNAKWGIWAFTESQKQVELRNPDGTWRLGAAQNEGRAYHSTALLLPDGRVLSAGDDHNGPDGPYGNLDNDTAEIYEPPYLFKGPRPTITRAPSALGWNAEFTVDTDGGVTDAVLIAPGAATHALDMNQRLVPLRLVQDGGGRKTFRSPPSKHVALPGYYMLFVLDGKGVPSVAAWVRLRDGAVEYAPGPVTPGSPAVPSPGPVPATGPNSATAPRTTAGTPHGETLGRRDSTRARLSAAIVRRKGRKVIRVRVPRSAARQVRVKLALRDAKRRRLLVIERTLRTGRTTYVSLRPHTRARSRVRSVVATVIPAKRSG